MVGELRARHVIHLHRLLREVARHCEEEYGMDHDRLAAYEDETVAPTDFKANKPDHEEAVMQLAHVVGQWSSQQLDDHALPDDDTEPESLLTAGGS